MEGNNGEELRAKREMNLFFGLADAMATIVYLNRRHGQLEKQNVQQG